MSAAPYIVGHYYKGKGYYLGTIEGAHHFRRHWNARGSHGGARYHLEPITKEKARPPPAPSSWLLMTPEGRNPARV